MASTFTFVVPPNSFRSVNLQAANLAAQSYAESHAFAARFCLDAIQTFVCADEVFASFVSTNPNLVFVLTSGALPSGITFSQGVLAGIPTFPGIYSFTITAQDGSGNYASRDYTINVGGITNNTFPDGTTGTAYSQFVQSGGFTDPGYFISGGALPTGLSLNPTSGQIFGTPTAAGVYDFVVDVQQGDNTCFAALSITITSSAGPHTYWKLDNASAQTNVDSVTGALLSVDADAVATPAKISNGILMPDGISGFGVQQTGPALAYTGTNGWSITCWFNYPFSGGAGGPGEGVMIYRFDTAGGASQLYVDFWAGVWFMTFNGGGSDGGVLNYGTPATWNFFSATYDGVTGALSFGVNNGGFTAGNCGPGPTVIDPAAILFFGVEDLGIDEVGSFASKLTPTQVAFLYNGGAGRAYPFTLPP